MSEGNVCDVKMWVIVYRVWRQECTTSALVQLQMPSSLLLTRLGFRLRTRRLRQHVETSSLLLASLLRTAKLHFCAHWKTKRIAWCAVAEYSHLWSHWKPYAQQLLMLLYNAINMYYAWFLFADCCSVLIIIIYNGNRLFLLSFMYFNVYCV